MNRVLLVNRVNYIGGVERIVLTLSDGLATCGWEPIMACPDTGDLAQAARDQGTKVAPCEFDRMRITADPRVFLRYPLATLRAARDIERHCRELKIDVLHVHHPVTALYASFASRRLGIPIVLHVHETLPARPLYALTLRLALRRASAVICVSNAAARLVESLSVGAPRSRVIYNGLDHRFMVCDAVPRLLGPGPHIGIFGVLEPRKGQHTLLEAAALLTEQFPTARYWLVGPAALKDKQAYVTRLHRLAEASTLRGRVEFAGFQSDIVLWIGSMDIVVQTSVALESFGMSIAEAMALGRAVVVTSVGGLPEVVSHDRTGLIVPPDDRIALAAALTRLLEDTNLRGCLGTAAFADARLRFAPEAFCEAVAQTYEMVK